MSIKLSEAEELFLLYLEDSPSIKVAAEKSGVSYSTGKLWAKKLTDTIMDRARVNLSSGVLKAVSVVTGSMDADAATEKGELKLKAAESLMDRVGLTKHTSVEVSIESENGIFILPAKAPLEPEEPTDSRGPNELPEDTIYL